MSEEKKCDYCKNKNRIWMCLECYGEFFDDIRLKIVKNENWEKDLEELNKK